MSSEWKLKLSDPVADRAGVALYAELSAGPSEVELEGKLIFDKRAGRFLGALNLAAEHEWASRSRRRSGRRSSRSSRPAAGS